VFDVVADRGVPDGAEVAPSARAVADRAEVVFASLPNREASLQVAGEVADGDAIRAFVETSTLGPTALREVETVLGDRVALRAQWLSPLVTQHGHATAPATPRVVGHRNRMAQSAGLVLPARHRHGAMASIRKPPSNGSNVVRNAFR